MRQSCGLIPHHSETGFCLSNKQTARSARLHCEVRYQIRKNLWISPTHADEFAGGFAGMARLRARMRVANRSRFSKPGPSRSSHEVPTDERPRILGCSFNQQTVWNPRGCCEVRYQNRKNLWITRPSRGTLNAESGTISESRLADSGRKPTFFGLSPSSRWSRSPRVARQTGKPTAAPVNIAKSAMFFEVFCG
mgnify:CR=1 FL=1